MKKITNVSIVGMGALGLLYADIIQNTLGTGIVQFVMDDERYHKYKGQTFTVNGIEKTFEIKSISNITQPADLVIIAVKYTGLNEDLLTWVKKLISPETIIISVLNGISSEKIIGQYLGSENIIYTVAQGMDAMKFGNNLKYTKAGELHIGTTKDTEKENLSALVEFFDRAKNPYIVEDDIIRRMWCKFMLNVGINQTCMAYGATYSQVLNQPELREVFIGAMSEVIKIAKAENINLTQADLEQYVKIIETLDPNGTPSMGQDRIQKRKSEVDLFAGTVIQIASQHKIEVPVNQMLYNKVQEIEKLY